VQYPEEKLPPVENARTIPFLVYDGDDAMAGVCAAPPAQICEKECPPQCIYIVKDTVKKPDYVGKMQIQPKVFDIDISVCMSCGICVEVCPFDSIKMDQVFELSTNDRFGGLLLTKRNWPSPTITSQIHPTEAPPKSMPAPKKSKQGRSQKARPPPQTAAGPNPAARSAK
jgi:NADH-quinone oxidoreductase subunit I